MRMAVVYLGGEGRGKLYIKTTITKMPSALEARIKFPRPRSENPRNAYVD